MMIDPNRLPTLEREYGVQFDRLPRTQRAMLWSLARERHGRDIAGHRQRVAALEIFAEQLAEAADESATILPFTQAGT